MNYRRWLEARRNGAADPDHAARLHGGGKGSAPPAPDYTGAATQQAAASKDIATQQTWANRPDVNTPWGSQTWDSGTSIDPSTGQAVTNWTQNINLSPEQQAANDAQQRITAGRSSAAETLLGQATGAFKAPFDWGSLPAAPGSVSDAQKGAYNTMSAALQPQRDRAVSALDTKLANMGLPMGSEAYKNAQMDQGNVFGQQDRANLAAAMAEGRSDIAAQQGERTQAIAEEAQRRGMSLNELNALLTGQQVSMPQMPGFTAAQGSQTPDLLGAASGAGNYGLAATQAKTAAQPDYGALAGTALTAGAMFMM